MKAAIRRRYGPPGDVVELADVERPTPGDDEVLVKVRAASVNRADLDGIQPRPRFVRLFIGVRAPRDPRLGLDVAGVVEAVGASVTRFQPGDEVFADLYPFGGGAFAEYACAPERAFLPIPAGLSFAEAATLPHSAILAIQGLRRRNGRTVRPGDSVLIDGASGNVGPFAIQIAKSMGAEVTAVASQAKLDFVRSLGADHVIDYTTVDYTATGARYDWILDTDSHHPIRRVRRALRSGGTYVTLGGEARPLIGALILGPLASLASDKSSRAAPVVEAVRSGRRRDPDRPCRERRGHASIDRRFPLSETVAALQWMDDGHARGKVVIDV